MTKNTINAKIVADSIDPRGNRITTFVLTYPRIIHAEMMTHRVFSRNAASSRAIPFNKMVKSVLDDPFIPIAWQKDHKGMQGTEYFTESEFIDIEPEYAEDPNVTNVLAIPHLKSMWLHAKESAISMSVALNKSKSTKQLCNRLLEPYQWYTCLVTTTELENFYKLRCPQYTNGYDETFRSRKDYINGTAEPEMYPTSEVGWWSISKSGAEIHIQALAEAMWDAKNESIPKSLKAGEYHLPFIDKMNTSGDDADNLWQAIKDNHPRGVYEYFTTPYEVFVATARCARLSYMTFDGDIDYDKDIKLHNQLLESKHASPMEHCALCQNDNLWYSNFKGWKSYRKILENDGTL